LVRIKDQKVSSPVSCVALAAMPLPMALLPACNAQLANIKASQAKRVAATACLVTPTINKGNQLAFNAKAATLVIPAACTIASAARRALINRSPAKVNASPASLVVLRAAKLKPAALSALLALIHRSTGL
jgi:hypothetical protein